MGYRMVRAVARPRGRQSALGKGVRYTLLDLAKSVAIFIVDSLLYDCANHSKSAYGQSG
jgi:hypothetical protein